MIMSVGLGWLFVIYRVLGDWDIMEHGHGSIWVVAAAGEVWGMGMANSIGIAEGVNSQTKIYRNPKHRSVGKDMEGKVTNSLVSEAKENLAALEKDYEVGIKKIKW